MMKKISIIGAGYVGSSIAYSLMLTDAARQIALIDINETAADAEVADIRPGFSGISLTKVYRGSYADTADSDIVVVTAGVNRKPGESRMDLIGKNAVIAKDISAKLKENKARGIVIVVSNPVDVITQIIARELNETTGRVFGTGCILDSARFRCVLGDFLGVEETVVRAFVAGEHGPGQILLWSSVTVENQPLTEWLTAQGKTLSETDKQTIAETVAGLGARIIAGKQRTHYGIAGCVAYIVNEMKEGRRTLLSLTFPAANENISVSRPCLLTETGVTETASDSLSFEEAEQIGQTMTRLKQIAL